MKRNDLWWDKTWNPITGCSPVSEGCEHCWAKRMANRLRGRYGYPQDEPFRVTFEPVRASASRASLGHPSLTCNKL